MDLLPKLGDPSDEECLFEFDEPEDTSATPEPRGPASPEPRGPASPHAGPAKAAKPSQDIFEDPLKKPTKKKREASEKQKAHLKVIREKAAARKKELLEEKRKQQELEAQERVVLKRQEEERKASHLIEKTHYTRQEVDALVDQKLKEARKKDLEAKIAQEETALKATRPKSAWEEWI